MPFTCKKCNSKVREEEVEGHGEHEAKFYRCMCSASLVTLQGVFPIGRGDVDPKKYQFIEANRIIHVSPPMEFLKGDSVE